MYELREMLEVQEGYTETYFLDGNCMSCYMLLVFGYFNFVELYFL